MKVIKNIDSHDIEMPFEGFTYVLPQDKMISVPDELSEFLEDRLPLSFEFKIKPQKGAVPLVKKTKTPVMIQSQPPNPLGETPIQDMKIMPVHPKATFGNPSEDLPASGVTDADGVSWYGEGIEVEGGNA